MPYDPTDAAPILGATPSVLRALLADASDAWIRSRERDDSWSPFDVVGHLVHGERTDWVTRARMILEQGGKEPFPPFDRFAQFEDSKGKTIANLLDEFAELRATNLVSFTSWDLTAEDLARPGRHPALGPVTLRQLLSTWVVHDLGHIAQISRGMAARYRDEVGPWREYLTVLG